jgi:diadenosine tetraphosphatase ApaH/serine/threonine PP2A family protein phosphatase
LHFQEGVPGQLAPGATVVDLEPGRHILNPGSVGQPRDGDPRAAWLEVDISSGRATFRRTDYPVERTQSEMRELGLPEVLAARLEHGI